MITPPVEPPLRLEELPLWWASWTNYVRDNPGLAESRNGEELYWGDHLFVGCEQHNLLSRAARAVGRRTSSFANDLQYEEVTDLRTWERTQPAPLLLHEKILAEHC